MNNAVKAVNLYYSYMIDEEHSQQALNGVTINISEGEFIGILGHNGSGKSTFAKHINVLLKTQKGEFYVLGYDAKDENNTWDIRSHAGMVFQNPDNQIVSSIVEEDVAFGPENLGIPPKEIEVRVNSALSAVDMEGFNERAPHMLSGGQKQRVAIAGVLAMHPDIIVFDEPTAMLDPQGRAEVMDVIKMLNKEMKKTVILITHYMEEVTGCDRVVVMDNGKITDDGTPHEVFSHRDILKKAGLLPPNASIIADKLAQSGIKLEKYPITLDELVDQICLLK